MELDVQLIDPEGYRKMSSIPDGALNPAPVRLCAPCNLRNIELISCSREHLRRRTLSPSSRPTIGELCFQAQLGKDEDAKKSLSTSQRMTRSLAATPLERTSTEMPASKKGTRATVPASVSVISKLCRNQVAPAGMYHLSLRYGPLVIESGLSKEEIAGEAFSIRKGILVSPRFNPVLQADRRSSAILLYDPEHRREVKTNEEI